MENLEKRNQELYMLIQLLATYGPTTLNEKELLEVCQAYKNLHTKFNYKKSIIGVNNIVLSLSLIDVFLRDANVVNGSILTFTALNNSFIIKEYLKYRLKMKNEIDTIKKFKNSKVRTPEAYKKLKKQLLDYQQEYDNNLKLIKQKRENDKLLNKVKS